ncbi:hypothetical protein [Shimia ponticola]|uniref:hypothetical protein n=1 Tax=Shimia ponticola TaxID=2582893 RepID=UPI0011BF1EA5|nr:hypothetical protein [Shimia ponticola]
MHTKSLIVAMAIASTTLSGCMGGAAGVVASQAVTSAATAGVARNSHLRRFRAMDCAAINAEIAASARAITNPLVGDGGYSAAARQVAEEKGC